MDPQQLLEMDRKLNYLKQEVDNCRWKQEHIFGVLNEIKKLIMEKFEN